MLERQKKACRSHSQHNISNQVCSVYLFLHCSAKTTEQQGVMVIKETTPPLEDAVLRPPCWQASVPLLYGPEPLPAGWMCELSSIEIPLTLWKLYRLGVFVQLFCTHR